MRQNLDVLNFIIKAERKSEFAYTVGMTAVSDSQINRNPQILPWHCEEYSDFKVLSMQCSFPRTTLCLMCVWLYLQWDQWEKKWNSTDSVGSREWKRWGSLTFLPYSQSEIFKAEATIDGLARCFPWNCLREALFCPQWCNCLMKEK